MKTITFTKEKKCMTIEMGFGIPPRIKPFKHKKPTIFVHFPLD